MCRTSGRSVVACLISEFYKTRLARLAKSSHSQAPKGKCLCLIQLYQMIQAQHEVCLICLYQWV
jgi:hypothetical protein